MARRGQTRGLKTLLFTDIVGSSDIAVEVGDQRWRKLQTLHHAAIRRQIKRFDGREVDTAGDGFFVTFDAPGPAVRCAAAAVAAVRELGIEIRAGLHFGEAELERGKVAGIAVTTAARVSAKAGPGQVLVTSTVADLVAGSGLEFDPVGVQELKGVPGTWALFELRTVDGDALAEPIGFATTRDRRAEAARRSDPRRRRFVTLAAIAVAVALVAVAIPLVRSGDADVSITTNSAARLHAGDGGFELATELGLRPGASAVGFGSLWVTQPDRGRVVRLNLEDGAIVDSIPVGTAPDGIAVGEGAVWVTNTADGTVSRIDAETNTVSQNLRAGSGPGGIAIGDGALWIADSVGTELLRVDPASGATRAVALSGQPTGVAFTPDGVWVSIAPNSVARIDTAHPAHLTTAFEATVGSGPTAVVAAHGSVWVANHIDGTVSRLDPSTGHQVAVIEVGDGPIAFGPTADALWVANEYDASISRIDPTSNAVEQTTPVGASAIGLTVDGEDLWLAVGASPTEYRGGTLSVVSEEKLPPSLDPAIAWDLTTWQILTMTNDGLLAYKRVGGPDGVTLVPDLAASLPQVSEDGLTYRFPLRQGVTYSTGEPVRPEDFRHAVERTLILSEANGLFAAIKGAGACFEKPKACDLSASIETSDDAVTFHLSRPDADLPFKLAMPWAYPVPMNIPFDDQLRKAIPATGPYTIDEVGRDGIRFVRNPSFREWSIAAQPDGFVDEIAWRFGQEPSAAFDQLGDGSVDVMMDPPTSEDLASLLASQPEQVFLSPTFWSFFVGFDVQQPPFDDALVRQAVNYAIDRDHVVDLLGGPTAHDATCQILPPTFQGYAPFCPYTVEPDIGVWSAPDVDRARALIDEAGAGGQEVTVWVHEGGVAPGAVETTEYVTEVLNDIGLRARLEVVDEDEDYFGLVSVPAGTSDHPQAFFLAWASDYPAASNYIEAQFACSPRGWFNPFGWCDEEVDRQMDEAQRLYRTDPGASSRSWAEIEHHLIEQAVMAPLTNRVARYAVSARAGNVQINPQWGILLTRIWVE